MKNEMSGGQHSSMRVRRDQVNFSLGQAISVVSGKDRARVGFKKNCQSADPCLNSRPDAIHRFYTVYGHSMH